MTKHLDPDQAAELIADTFDWRSSNRCRMLASEVAAYLGFPDNPAATLAVSKALQNLRELNQVRKLNTMQPYPNGKKRRANVWVLPERLADPDWYKQPGPTAKLTIIAELQKLNWADQSGWVWMTAYQVAEAIGIPFNGGVSTAVKYAVQLFDAAKVERTSAGTRYLLPPVLRKSHHSDKVTS